MEKQPSDIVPRVDAALAANLLRPKAKALLLLRLCHICSVVSPQKANAYWSQLASMGNNMPDDLASAFDDLRQSFEEQKASTRGFAGERIAEINAALSKPGRPEKEVRACLKAVEELVQKRFWPFGKEAVWQALVKAWAGIDRTYALTLSGRINPTLRSTVVRRMNRQKPLARDEWTALVKAASLQDAVAIARRILDSLQPDLDLPPDVLPEAILSLAGLPMFWTTETEDLCKEALDKIEKLVSLTATADRLPCVFDSLKDAARELAARTALSGKWAELFHAVARMIAIGVSSGAVTDANAEAFTEGLPAHMIDFGRAHCSALLSTSDTARKKLGELLNVAEVKAQAEAWFLVVLAIRNMGELSYSLAKESPRSAELLPRIRRAWLCNDPRAASTAVSPSDVEGDPAALILLRAPGGDRVDYLRELTQDGKKPLPAAVWATEEKPEEKKGFWASLMSSGKTFDEAADEYLKRNPLYSSYRADTPEAQQFTEYLRFSGYGEYGHDLIDRALLEAFVPWADDNPDDVRALMHRMWEAIRPEEDILKVDFLRNAIFTRCTTVFAAAPDVLTSDFLSWLKATLIDRSLAWQIGKTQYSLHYPESALASMCVRAALAVHGGSPARSDQLVEAALTRYPSQAGTAELAARLYNTGKEPFDLTLPWKTKGDVEEAWQVGIIKNATEPIMLAFVESQTAQ